MSKKKDVKEEFKRYVKSLRSTSASFFLYSRDTGAKGRKTFTCGALQWSSVGRIHGYLRKCLRIILFRRIDFDKYFGIDSVRNRLLCKCMYAIYTSQKI